MNESTKESAASAAGDARDIAERIVASCRFGYAIDEDGTESPNVIEANETWLIDRIAAALRSSRTDERRAAFDEAIGIVRDNFPITDGKDLEETLDELRTARDATPTEGENK